MMDGDYIRDWWVNQHKNQYFKSFVSYFSYPKMNRFDLKDKDILEIGFGYGRELLKFYELSKNVYGVELSTACFDLVHERAKEKGVTFPNGQLSAYDGMTLPFDVRANLKFDFIYSCFVIQHMCKANAKNLITTSLKLLKEGGRVFFEFFGHPDFMGRDTDAISGDSKDGMYNNAFSKGEIIKLIDSTGGKIDFIDEWPVSEKNGKGEDIKFCNYWVCIKR